MNNYQNRFKHKMRYCKYCGKPLSPWIKTKYCLKCAKGRKIVKERGGSVL